VIDTDVNEFIRFLRYSKSAKNSSFACVLSRMRARYVGTRHHHDRICQEFSVGVEALGLALGIWSRLKKNDHLLINPWSTCWPDT